jgi:hypothetical protein
VDDLLNGRAVVVPLIDLLQQWPVHEAILPEEVVSCHVEEAKKVSERVHPGISATLNELQNEPERFPALQPAMEEKFGWSIGAGAASYLACSGESKARLFTWGEPGTVGLRLELQAGSISRLQQSLVGQIRLAVSLQFGSSLVSSDFTANWSRHSFTGLLGLQSDWSRHSFP